MSEAAAKSAPKAGNANPPLAPFNWQDPLLLESQLTEEERLVRDSARAFA
ncbi:acyl-CoA dehydrogenase, partial [Aerococcus loyolae]